MSFAVPAQSEIPIIIAHLRSGSGGKIPKIPVATPSEGFAFAFPPTIVFLGVISTFEALLFSNANAGKKNVYKKHQCQKRKNHNFSHFLTLNLIKSYYSNYLNIYRKCKRKIIKFYLKSISLFFIIFRINIFIIFKNTNFIIIY